MVQEEEGLVEHIHEDPRMAKIQAVRQKVGQDSVKGATCTYVNTSLPVCVPSGSRLVSVVCCQGPCREPDPMPKPAVLGFGCSVLGLRKYYLQVGIVRSLVLYNQTP